MVKRDRRVSDNWKSKIYHLQFGKLISSSVWKTYRNYPFNWLGRDWSGGDWHRRWLICYGCLDWGRGRLIRRWCLDWGHCRTYGRDLVNTSLVSTCTNKCQITLATLNKATMCTVSITFTMLSTTICRLWRWFDGRRYSRRVSFTSSLRCHILGYFISSTRI